MGGKRKPPLPEALEAEKKHLDELLDEALRETFPASDPPAICIEHVPEVPPARPAPRRRPKG